MSERHPAALVIGADQILASGGRIFSKALDEIEARATLLALRGCDHELISAAVMARAGQAIWRRTETATMRMREFSDEFLDEYLTAEIPDVLGSVGCYRIEGRGAQLFSGNIRRSFLHSRAAADRRCLRPCAKHGALLS